MLNAIDTKFLNDVKNRFLPLPRSASEGLEHEPQITDFEIIKELGVGSFGQVYLAKHKKTKAIYAIKSIDKTDDQNLEEKANFSREVEIMYKLHHPNIVKLYGHFEDSNYCYFIMQYIPKRSVYEIIPKAGKKPNLQLIASVMKDLVSAVYYLHNMKPIIIHRDIKPENILLDENSRAYLTDFGWSNYVQSFKRRTTVCGTPLYLPPEMVNETSHDEKADIWCIGVLLFELSTGKVPFDGRDLETVKANILRLNISWPREIDPEVKDLISQILRLNPKSRLSIEEILSHSFFTKYFPNAVNELIKPDHQQNKIFVVSQDDPKTWGEIKKKPTVSTSSSSGAGNINSNNNASISTNTNVNTNTNSNNYTKINARSSNTRINSISNSNANPNANTNANSNIPRNYQRTKAFLVPKTEIDLTSNERGNSHNRRSSGRGSNTKMIHSHNNSLNKSNRASNAHKSFNTNTNNYRYSVKYNLRDNHSKNTTATNNNSFRNSNTTYNSNTTNYTNSSNNRGSFKTNLVGYTNNNYSTSTTSKGNPGSIKKTSTYSSNTFSKVNRMSYRNSNSKKYANNNSNATDKNRMSFRHNNHTNYNSNTINNNRSAYNPFLSNQYIQ